MSALSHVVHLGDCLDPVSGLASLPDQSVDHRACGARAARMRRTKKRAEGRA